MKAKIKNQFIKLVFWGLVFALAGGFLVPPKTQAANATLSLTPGNGTYMVDSTFDVSVYLDTQGQSINTIELNLRFPADKLQLVSASTGKSIIGIWTSQPKFNNQAGTVYLVGGIPGGITISRGLISTFTFRVRAVGSAVVKFDASRVLLNDGMGTEVMTQNSNSIYSLILPPPEGPSVTSDTHPDQTRWYKSNTASLKWTSEGAEGYSYVLNDTPIDTPDDISEGDRTDVVYRSLAEGRYYFHIRALRAGRWGGTTHFALNVDPNPPADFRIEFVPDRHTSSRQPVFQFVTTDASSGLDHYELRMVSLSPETKSESAFFIEAQSPYISNPLEIGKYDVFIRAFDKAGNYREVKDRLEIVTPVFNYVRGEGFNVKGWFTVPWYALWVSLGLVILILLYLIKRLHLWHGHIDRKRESKELPPTVQQQMEELEKYRAKYGKITMILLAAIALSLVYQPVKAATEVLSPPIVTTVSQNISDEDIFYIGGEVSTGSAEVVVYLQSADSSATYSEVVTASKDGDWFYRHNALLTPGNYLLWTQSRVGDQMSPPSPQIDLAVETTAIHFGATRLSYSTLYLLLTLVFGSIALALLIYLIVHAYRGHKKHATFMREINEAEASLKRGFAVLNRDIMAELEIIKKVKMSQALSAEEKKREDQLMQDLQNIERYLSDEIWQIKSAAE
jgi:hypothetical protein